jgi:hypothetical protein
MRALVLVVLAVSLASVSCGPAPVAWDWGLPPGIPAPRVPADNPMNAAKVELGRRLFYDVRLSEVVFVAETSKLPKIFDALASQNFMTVADVRISPADPFEAAREGYLYGPEPVSVVTATIESVWLREWTAQYMPAAVRTALGIQSAPPAGASSESAPQTGM